MLLFSSRRRHPRYWRDWSSDVCSSDLDDASEESDEAGGEVSNCEDDEEGESSEEEESSTSEEEHSVHSQDKGVMQLPLGRSEERRVGKECSSRLSPYHSKQKSVVEVKT